MLTQELTNSVSVSCEIVTKYAENFAVDKQKNKPWIAVLNCEASSDPEVDLISNQKLSYTSFLLGDIGAYS
jgi:hypothetical protein